MVLEAACNTLAITDILFKDHPIIANTISEACQKKGIEIIIIKGANDYWCRDFMPLQVNTKKFVQFIYDPSYYKHNKYRYLKTEIRQLNFYPQQTILKSNIVLDGGNICHYKTKAIITDKLFKDNPDSTRNVILDEITTLLELDELVIIPALPYDITGHADGMVKFIDDGNLILNDFRKICSESYWKKLQKALRKFNCVLLPNDLHKNKIKDDATGDYINMVQIGNLVFLPTYNKDAEQLAIKIIQTTYPGLTIIPIPSNQLAIKGGILHCATYNLLR